VVVSNGNGSQDGARVIGGIIAIVAAFIGFVARSGGSHHSRYDPGLYAPKPYNTDFLRDMVARAMELENGKQPPRVDDAVQVVGPLQFLTDRSTGSVTVRNFAEGMVDFANLDFACQGASEALSVRRREPLNRLAPHQERTLHLAEIGNCPSRIVWTVEGLQVVGRSDAAARLVETLVDPASPQLAAGPWVSFLEKEYAPEFRVPLVVAAAHGLALDVSGPEERAMALGALEELRDPNSRLSLLANADVALVPLLEASAGTFTREERLLVQGIVAAYTGERAASLSAEGMLLRARGHDAVSRSQPVVTRAEAMRQLTIVLSRNPSPEVAEALLTHWLMTDEPAVSLQTLTEMPQLAAGAMLARLDQPTGAERRWFTSSSPFVTNPSIARVLDAELGSTLQSRLETSAHLFQARQQQHLDGLVAQWDSQKGREAVRIAPADRSSALRSRLADELTKQAALQPPHVAEVLLDEALKLDPAQAREARGRLEAAMLDTLTTDDTLFDGPSPAWPQHRVENAALLERSGTSAGEFVLVTSAGQSGYRPSWGVTGLIKRRLDAMDAAGVPVPWAMAYRARAFWLEVRWSLAALLGAFAFVVLVASWKKPERVALVLARRGWFRTLALGLMRRRARSLPNEAQVFLCVQVLTELATRDRERAPAFLEEAIALRVESVDTTPDTSALIGRLRLLSGDDAAAREAFEAYVKHASSAAHPAWLLRSVHQDLARLSWRRRDDAAARRHALLAGDAMLAAAAGLRAGAPTTQGLWPLAARRHDARLLLVHLLIDTRRFTLASLVARLLRARDPHATFARARLAHARGQLVEAKAAYQAVRSAKAEHQGAKLGLAMLEDDRAALEAVATGTDEAALSARLRLACQSRIPTEALGKLAGLGTCSHWQEAHTIATQHCQLNQFDLATIAMKRAIELGGGPVLEAGPLAIATRAMQVGEPRAALATLQQTTATASTRMVAHLAQWTLALRWFRAAPQEGFEAARKATGDSPLGDGEWLGIPTPFLKVATLLAQGRLHDARVEAEAHQNEPLCAWLAAVSSAEPIPTTAANDAAVLTLRAEQIRAQYPSIRGAFDLVHAAGLFARGHLTQARATLEKVPFSSDLSDPVTFARAGLAAAMGAKAEHGLGALLALTRDEEHPRAIAALEALEGTPCAAARELRLALGARVALSALQQERLADVAPALRAALQWRPQPADAFSEAFTKVREALALADTSQWHVTAFDHPGFALGAVQGQTHAVLSVVQLAKAPTPEHLETALRSLSDLSENRGTLAQYRLRALELAGAMPLASRTEFEDEVQERLTKLVVAVLEALLAEHVSILSAAMSKWPGEDGLVPRARRVLAKQLGEVMRETLDRAELRAKERKTQALARDLFLEVDLAVTRHLLELKRLGASEETVASASDVAARSFDQLSIDFYNLYGPSSVAISSVNRALELEREENTRARLQRNRALMVG
jgi:hypothetical protein